MHLHTYNTKKDILCQKTGIRRDEVDYHGPYKAKVKAIGKSLRFHDFVSLFLFFFFLCKKIRKRDRERREDRRENEKGERGVQRGWGKGNESFVSTPASFFFTFATIYNKRYT